MKTGELLTKVMTIDAALQVAWSHYIRFSCISEDDTAT